MNAELKKAKNLSDKHLMMFLLMNEWVKVKQQNKSIAQYLKIRGISSLAIYGMSYIGQRLVDELLDSEIKIVKLYDAKSGGKYRGMDIVSAEKGSDSLHDAVIVTPIFYYDEICESLTKKGFARTINIEEIIYGMTND